MMKWFFALVLLLWPLRAHAHGFSPAMLELREESPRRYRVTWTVADVAEPTLKPELAAGCRAVDPVHVECAQTLAGTRVRFPGLAQSKLTVIVRFVPLDAEPTTTIAEGASDVITLPATRSTSARGYLRLGVEHVLTGFDHLLFVLCLAAWVRAPRAILVVLTSFTIAHSITLAAAVLDVVRVPSAPVEVCIAASVVLLAAQLARRPQVVAPPRTAARIAFAAGLLHGLGFAGALAEIGVPRGNVAATLLAFNVGVELGQVAFVAVVLLAAAAVRSAARQRARTLERALIFGSGCVAAYALIERAASL